MAITGTKEWMPNSVNCRVGCEHTCRYGYCWRNAKRYGLITSFDEWKESKPAKNAMRRIKFFEGGVMFPTTHDLLPQHKDQWSPFLKGILEKGNKVLIVSKPHLESIEHICNTFSEYKPNIEFRFTIGTIEEASRAFWEPGAPSMAERIRCLKYAFDNGYATSVSMEPLLVDNPLPVIDIVDKYVTGTIWIGLMNYIQPSEFKADEMKWYNSQQHINSLENIKKVHAATRNNLKIRYKDSVRDLLGMKS